MDAGRKPEVMSPAGHWPQLNAAIEAGADSVYFGLTHFSARAKVGFTKDELADALRTLHRRGVKGYVAFNTLVFDAELSEAAQAIEWIADAGADAIIVQDLGVCELIRQVAPDLEIHASTQMSVTNVEGVRLAQRLGATRVNLARELSIDEIRTIRAATDCELEIFVHGALCVAYSGQCFSSEAWGGRSANRGQCAQACRLPYELVVDGAVRPLGDARYLLSPGDLFALEHIPELTSIGLASFKIEGRYKDAEYVAVVTDAYRRAVDAAWEGRSKAVSAAERVTLEQVYSRGLGAFFLNGTDHQAVVSGRGPRHRGVLMGLVLRVSETSIIVQTTDAALKPGDGVVFDAADWRSPEEPEEGGRVYGVRPVDDRSVELEFANGSIRFHRIRAGDLLWRSSDPEVEKFARKWTAASGPVYRRKVDVEVEAIAGAPLRMRWSRQDGGASVSVASDEPLAHAERRGLTKDGLREQLGRLGNTPLELGKVEARIEGDPFVPVSLLNKLRREGVEGLLAQTPRRKGLRVATQPEPMPQQLSGPSTAQIHLLLRSPGQLEAAIACRPASITLDYLDLYGLRPSVAAVRDRGIEIRVASPRVMKPGEEAIVEFLLKLEVGILVRSAGLLNDLAVRKIQNLSGDFSLNAANARSAKVLLDMGLRRLTLGYDLNGEQIAALAAEAGAASIEAVVYQHLPVFHTEHCVFCRFMSTGTDFTNCGRPCESHRIALRDDRSREHPVLADVGCRNTVFGVEAQEASAHVERWRGVGIEHFRLEFVQETPRALTRIVSEYSALFEKRRSSRDFGAIIRKLAPGGTTEGSLIVPETSGKAPFRIL